MTKRFVEYYLQNMLTLLVDRETGVEYLKTYYSQLPIMDHEGQLQLTTLPKLPEILEATSKRDYGRDLKERFVFSHEKLSLFKMSYLVLDQQTGIEYFLSGGVITPLLTEHGQLKMKEN